jgi:hypothetical protein
MPSLPELKVGQVWQCAQQNKTLKVQSVSETAPGHFQVYGVDENDHTESFVTTFRTTGQARDCWGPATDEAVQDWYGLELVQLLWCPTWKSQ